MGLGSTLGTVAGGVGGFALGGPGGAVAGAGLGGALGGLFDDDTPQQAEVSRLDPNDPRYQYGGGPGKGGLNADDLTKAGFSQGGTAAPTADYGQANGDYGMQLAARQQQQGLADRLTGVLDGTGPATQAQLQMADGQRQAIAQGQQQAASARGTNALIQARAAGVGATLGAQRSIADSAMLRAREEAQARGELGQVLGGMRGQDQSSRSESAGQSQFQTEMEMRQRAENNKQQLGLFGLANDISKTQLDANLRVGQGNQGSSDGVSKFNAGQRSDADQRGRQAQAGLNNGLMQGGMGMMNSSKPGAPSPGAPPSPSPPPVGLTQSDYAPQEPQRASFVYDPSKRAAATGGGMSGGNPGLY